MLIKQRRFLNFEIEGQGDGFSFPVPTVGHVERLVKWEADMASRWEEIEKEDNRAMGLDMAIERFLLLALPLHPGTNDEGARIEYEAEKNRVKKWLLSLTFEQLGEVMQALLAASYGIDLEELDNLQKKNALTGKEINEEKTGISPN